MINPPAAAFDEAWTTLASIGRDPATGGYHRHGWDEAESAARDWFRTQARRRELPVEQDGNGNLWAWWADGANDTVGAKHTDDANDAVVTGSHLDSVPDGGAYDGALGVAAGFVAIDLLRARGVQPRKPLAVVAWTEEEGSRFGIACLGSQLATGRLDAGRARTLRDRRGVSLADAMSAAGADPAGLGPTPDRLHRIGAFVELHIEQGRGLVDLDAPVGVGTAIWPHGRWRLEIVGVPDHAGTTRLADRRDPMLTFANTVLSARKKARLADAVATIGRVDVHPNSTNTIPARVTARLDARAPDDASLAALVEEISTATAQRADRDGTTVELIAESQSPGVRFDPALAASLDSLPRLDTAAGHDAGILAGTVPTTMLFVRNPTGVSHSPAEYADRADCLAGIETLANLLAELVAA